MTSAAVAPIPTAPRLREPVDLPADPTGLPIRVIVGRSRRIATAVFLVVAVLPLAPALFVPFGVLAKAAPLARPVILGGYMLLLAVLLLLAGRNLRRAIAEPGEIEITQTGIMDARVLARPLPWSVLTGASLAKDLAGRRMAAFTVVRLEAADLTPYLRPDAWTAWRRPPWAGGIRPRTAVGIDLNGHDATRLHRLAVAMIARRNGSEAT